MDQRNLAKEHPRNSLVNVLHCHYSSGTRALCGLIRGIHISRTDLKELSNFLRTDPLEKEVILIRVMLGLHISIKYISLNGNNLKIQDTFSR